MGAGGMGGGGSKAMGGWGKASVQTDDYHHKYAHAADNLGQKWTKKFLYFEF